MFLSPQTDFCTYIPPDVARTHVIKIKRTVICQEFTCEPRWKVYVYRQKKNRTQNPSPFDVTKNGRIRNVPGYSIAIIYRNSRSGLSRPSDLFRNVWRTFDHPLTYLTVCGKFPHVLRLARENRTRQRTAITTRSYVLCHCVKNVLLCW